MGKILRNRETFLHKGGLRREVSMIGAEINEEKTSKSMEIIISSVSPKIHFAAHKKHVTKHSFLIIFSLLFL